MLVAAKGGQNALKESGVLSQPLDVTQGALGEFFARFRNLSLLFEQADTTLTPAQFFMISGGMAVAGSIAAAATGLNPAFVPIFTVLTGILPLIWIVFRRRRRLRNFGKQLPDALGTDCPRTACRPQFGGRISSGGGGNGRANQRRISARL